MCFRIVESESIKLSAVSLQLSAYLRGVEERRIRIISSRVRR
jgi:hypothetical protein